MNLIFNHKLKTKKYKNKQAFTLVELIVVITILAILGSIAFISLQGYSRNARDGQRISDISNIKKGISLYQAKSGLLPTSEQYTTITASGTIIRYQGVAGANVLNTAGLGNLQQGGGRDPITGEYYTYITDGNKYKFQLVGYFEALANNNTNSNKILTNINLVQKVNAMYTGALIKTYGSDLGVIWDITTNKSINETFAGTGILDIRNTTNTYKVIFNETDEIIGTGGELFTQIYNRDTILLNDKNLAQLDDYLVGYWDMETLCVSGSCGALNNGKLKDFSKYGNNGVCYRSSTIYNCGTNGLGPQFVSGNGKNGKAMSFDGISRVDVGSDSSLFNPEAMTVFAIYRPIYGLGTYQYIVVRNNFQLRSHTEGGDQILNWFHLGGGWNSPGGAYNTKEGSWYSPVISYNANQSSNNLKFYVNGNIIIAKTVSGQITFAAGTLQIGTNSNEIIDEVRIYNRALSDLEVQKLYQSVK